MCDLQCEEDYDGSGDPSYVCDVLSNGSVMWMTSRGGWNCKRSKLLYYCLWLLNVLMYVVIAYTYVWYGKGHKYDRLVVHNIWWNILYGHP